MHAIVKTVVAMLLLAHSSSAPSSGIVRSGVSSFHLQGKGRVTVVFESGLGDSGKVWRSVQSSISPQCARTVSYTRREDSGTSRRHPRDARQIVAELRRQLQDAGLPPPYVLVGHSLGGLYMQYFARRYPTEVSGLVLVDSMHWAQLDRVRVSVPGVYRTMSWLTMLRGGVMRREYEGIPSTTAEIEALPMTTAFPTIVLSRTNYSMGDSPEFRKLAAQLQGELADAYAARRHEFVPASGHYIQIDQPQVVIDAVHELSGCDTAKRREG